MSDYDYDNEIAPQSLAWEVVGPEMMGFILQTFISGACFQKAARCYSSESTLSKTMKRILTVVLVLNALVQCSTIAEMLLWSTTQKRTPDDLWSFQIPDAYQPIPAGLITCVVQFFFADRAWKILNKNMFFLFFIGICIILSLAGAIGLGVVQLLNMDGTTAFSLLLIFTEIWTWTSAVTDLAISCTIIFGLLSRKTGYEMPTDNLVMKIVNAAMQSASMTTTFTTAAAIIYAIQWDSNSAAVDLAFMYPIPALYTYSLLWCLATNDRIRKEHASRITSDPSFSTGAGQSQDSSDITLASDSIQKGLAEYALQSGDEES